MSLRFIVIHLLAAMLVAPVARAQDPQLWHSYVERLAPGAYVVVQLRNGRSVQGHFVRVTDDAITVLPKKRLPEPARVIAFVDVASIDARREGMSPGAKVLIGVGSVAAGVLVLVAAFVPRT
jgi:hypothetical protein